MVATSSWLVAAAFAFNSGIARHCGSHSKPVWLPWYWWWKDSVLKELTSGDVSPVCKGHTVGDASSVELASSRSTMLLSPDPENAGNDNIAVILEPSSISSSKFKKVFFTFHATRWPPSGPLPPALSALSVGLPDSTATPSSGTAKRTVRAFATSTSSHSSSSAALCFRSQVTDVAAAACRAEDGVSTSRSPVSGVTVLK
mmetsp:Transcript_52967/g.138914  ORF Transcript_52967/g.138914 Transcript_52967/m.138914 type:complete len:200 (+) Transcript_52967:126-725(+)